MASYSPIDGRGGWFMDDATGDAVLLVNDTVVLRVTSASVVTATSLVGDVTGDVTGAVIGSTLSTSGATTTSATVGAIGADGTLVAEYGSGVVHVTELTFTKTESVLAAALSWGAECYTLPAVPCHIQSCSIDGYMQSTGAGGAVADVGEVGVGILVGSGVNATLAAVGATSENIITGTAHTGVATDTTGVADISGAGTLIAPVSAVIYANAAGTWSGADDVAFVGTMRIAWTALV